MNTISSPCSINAQVDTKLASEPPHVTSTFRDRLHERVRNLLAEHDVHIDRSDLIKEVSIYAERSDIAEEVVRLASHLDQFQGDGTTARLAGQQHEYLQKTMTEFRDRARGNNPGMSDLMNAASLEDIAALAPYLASLQIQGGSGGQ